MISFTLAHRQFELSAEDVRARIARHRPDPIHQYWVQIDDTRWPVKQVMSLATGLGKSEFQSQSSRRLLAKLGFGIGKSEAELTEPAAVSRSSRTPAPRETAPVPSRADVVLVGCVKSKSARGAPAKDLYISDYFAKMRAYAEGSGRPWFILSAEHGLVSPDAWLEPYDRALSKMDRDYRRGWGQRVAKQLQATVGPLDGLVFDIHAGAAYVEALEAALGPMGAVLVDQLKGLTFGQRLSWYLHQGRSQQAVSAQTIAELLRDPAQAITLVDLVASKGEGLRAPGIYGWWVDEAGAKDLSKGLGHKIAPGLIYAGLAGATRSGGSRSSNTLWGRIATMHLGKRHDLSTLRLTLGSILASANNQSGIDEERLTLWMRTHLSVVTIAVADVGTLGELEGDVLAMLDPPLNLAKVSKNPLRARLSVLRKQYSGSVDGTAT